MKKIILIEDNPDHADLITEALGEGGTEEVILVRDGMEAIDYFQELSVKRNEQIENIKINLSILF